MRSGNVGRLVTPNCPCAERQLNEKKRDPPHRQSLERANVWRVSPNPQTKFNYGDCNQQRQKSVRHLQPNLESVHVRQAARIAPGVDLCQCCRACIWNPRAVCGGKIENRQIAMLMAHCSPQRKLHINRERDRNSQCPNRSEFFRNDLNFPKTPPKTCSYKRDYHEQREKGLRDARVKDADFILQHRDTKATENSLQYHAHEREDAQVAHPCPASAAPKPDREDDRQESNYRRD